MRAAAGRPAGSRPPPHPAPPLKPTPSLSSARHAHASCHHPAVAGQPKFGSPFCTRGGVVVARFVLPCDSWSVEVPHHEERRSVIRLCVASVVTVVSVSTLSPFAASRRGGPGFGPLHLEERPDRRRRVRRRVRVPSRRPRTSSTPAPTSAAPTAAIRRPTAGSRCSTGSPTRTSISWAWRASPSIPRIPARSTWPAARTRRPRFPTAPSCARPIRGARSSAPTSPSSSAATKPGRGNGERMAVDPNDGRVLFLGTRQERPVEERRRRGDLEPR